MAVGGLKNFRQRISMSQQAHTLQWVRRHRIYIALIWEIRARNSELFCRVCDEYYLVEMEFCARRVFFLLRGYGVGIDTAVSGRTTSLLNAARALVAACLISNTDKPIWPRWETVLQGATGGALVSTDRIFARGARDDQTGDNGGNFAAF